MSKLWGGRFEKESDPLFKAFNDSLRFDYRLIREDVEGSIAWAKAISRAGILSADELSKLTAALQDVLRESPSGEIGPPTDATDEDVHSFVEARLVAKVGQLGKKLHTGRSRNDQVATDLRLWTRAAIDERMKELNAAALSLVGLAERSGEVIIPGFTHLQRAQPVVLGHWALAYVEMLERDMARFSDARKRVNVCPLGSGALAGTAFNVDRAALAKDLGFDAPTRNSLDGVSDRDFVVETLAASALCATHLSRIAEDLIIYSTDEFGLVEMDDGVTSGSSLMPQKKNPDACELLRGKCGRIVGALTGMLVAVKGLPLAYNKDMQEDKEPLFDAMDNLSMCLRMLVRVIDGLVVKTERARSAAMGGYSNSTDLADYLVENGVPFRDAHEMAGKIVRVAIEKKCMIEALPIAEMKKIAPQVEEDVVKRLTPEAVVGRRAVFGGTSPVRVKEAVAAARGRLS